MDGHSGNGLTARLPLIVMENSHTKDGDDPTDERDYDNAHRDRHATAAYGRKHLSADDGVNSCEELVPV